jgi:hypothetical protein
MVAPFEKMHEDTAMFSLVCSVGADANNLAVRSYDHKKILR